MSISLRKATLLDAELIHEMQIKAFLPLLEKYHDYEISPGAEMIDKIIQRLNQDFTDYYIIIVNTENVGAIRIINQIENGKCRVSPIFILPEYQNRGIAQNVFAQIETMYKPKNGWNLDTILEEKGNCHLYEKIGYQRIGEIKTVNDNMHIVYYEKKI